jgi:hypothetical protein
MSAAQKRVADLLDRWLASVELHARYLELNDADYSKAQTWPKHERPTKWVVQLARTRLEDMQQRLAARRDQGDDDFAESLELMSFLTNLLGSEHIDRFIPLASTKPNTGVSGTVKRPRLKATEGKAAAKTTTPAAARTEPQRRATPVPRPASAAPHAEPKAATPPDKVTATVIADAVRFLGWGREWPALAPLIARLADRPSEADIARILRANREAIERRARSRKK